MENQREADVDICHYCGLPSSGWIVVRQETRHEDIGITFVGFFEEPCCISCRDVLDKGGVVLAETRNKPTEEDPYPKPDRTGRFARLSAEAFRRCVNDDWLFERLMVKRLEGLLLHESRWEKLNLPANIPDLS